MATIAIERIKVRGYHGVYPEEKEKGNDFLVDLWMETNIMAAAQEDELAHTTDYGAVYELVLEIMNTPMDLLETLVVGLGNEILKRFPAITEVRVRVTKLTPMGMPECASTYVEETFSRG